ncbi:hypothetical protein PGB90_001039 [Kerria lacca]
MTKKLRIIPPPRHLIIFILATMWLNMQFTDGTETYRRFKRWSTTLLAKPVENHECKVDSDCRSVPNTSCAQDKTDKRMKCLCADYSHPTSEGDCKKLPKALRTPCQADIECLPGAECIFNSSDMKLSSKLCYCRQDYVEVNNTCSTGCSFSRGGPMALFVGASITLWRYT